MPHCALHLLLLLLVTVSLLVHAQESTQSITPTAQNEEGGRNVQLPRHRSNSIVGTKFAIEVPSRHARDAFVADTSAAARLHEALASSDKYIRVDRDGFVSTAGVGRIQRPRGISITRGMPTASKRNQAQDMNSLPVDNQAIAFGPERLDMGTRMTCASVVWHVDVMNHGSIDVRIDTLDVTRDGYEIVTDVRGMTLTPGTNVTVQFLFTPSQPEDEYEAFMRVRTSSGSFALQMTANIVSNPFGINGIRAIIPVGMRYDTTLYMENSLDYFVRVLDVFTLDPMGTFSMPYGVTAMTPPSLAKRGGPRTYAWDLPVGVQKPIINYTFVPREAGFYFTYIRIVLSSMQQLRIPVMLEAVDEGIRFEPTQIVIGTITTQDAHREVAIHIHNAASESIRIYDMQMIPDRPTTTMMNVSVTFNGPLVIPAKSRVLQALTLDVRRTFGQEDGECIATLALRTNYSGESRMMFGLSVTFLNGSIGYRFEDTSVQVIVPPLSQPMVETTIEPQRRGIENHRLYYSWNVSDSVHAGEIINRTLSLKNQYNIPIELERVWIPSESATDSLVEVVHYEAGVAGSGEYWPEIQLRITPATVYDRPLVPESIPIQVETSVAIHRVYVHVFYGLLHVVSSKGGDVLSSNASANGYLPATRPQSKKTPRECTPLSTFKAGGEDVKVCRSYVLSFGKMSSLGPRRTEILNFSSLDPVPINVEIVGLTTQSKLFDVSIHSSMSESAHASMEVNALGRQWTNDAELLRMVSPSMNLTSTRRRKQSSKKIRDAAIMIPPGYDMALHIGLQVKDVLGSFSEYMFTIETPLEFIHVYAEFENVEGTIEPVVREITLEPLFPGRHAVAELRYSSTFAHRLTLQGVAVRDPSIDVASMRAWFPENDTAGAVTLVFAPSNSKACSASRFYADCSLPLISDLEISTLPFLSDFGDFVTAEDLAALERRERLWEEFERAESSESIFPFEATVALHTDIMITEPIKLRAPMVRPRIRAAMPTHLEFPLTKVLECRYQYFSVYNPSDAPIHVEVAVAEHDQSLYYECDLELHNDDDDEQRCLEAWYALVKAQIATSETPQSEHHNKVAPFFFLKHAVRVNSKESEEVGPMYFCPTQVQDINSTIYFRNELTHIEPLYLTARSGQGALSVHIRDSDAQSCSELTEKTGACLANTTSDDGIVRFQMTELPHRALYPLLPRLKHRVLELTNTGNYKLVVKMTAFVNTSALWMADSFKLEPDRANEGAVMGNEDEDGVLKLAIDAGETIGIRLLSAPNCYLIRANAEVLIYGDDTYKRIPIIAEMSPKVAFECLRAQKFAVFVYFLRVIWKGVCMGASALAVYGLFIVMSDVISVFRHYSKLMHTDYDRVSVPTSSKIPNNGDKSIKLNQHDDNCEAVMKATSHFLDDLRANFYSSLDAATAQTPAVTKLLLGRQTKLAFALSEKESGKQEKKDEKAEQSAGTAPIPIPVLVPVAEMTVATAAAEAVGQEPRTPTARPKQLKQPSSRKVSDAEKKTANDKMSQDTRVKIQPKKPQELNATAAVSVAKTSIAAVGAEVDQEVHKANARQKHPKLPSPTQVIDPAKKTENGKTSPGSRRRVKQDMKKQEPALSADKANELMSNTKTNARTEKPKSIPGSRRKTQQEQLRRVVQEPVLSPSKTNAFASNATDGKPQINMLATKESSSPPSKSHAKKKKTPRRVKTDEQEAASQLSDKAKEKAQRGQLRGEDQQQKAVVDNAAVVATEATTTPTSSESNSFVLICNNGSSNNVDTQEPIDVLASSIDSTSTTVSTVSDDWKLSPHKAKYHLPAFKVQQKVDGDDDDAFLLSMELDTPFSSFGRIGGGARLSKQQKLLNSIEPSRGNQGEEEEEDAVLVENRFGVSSSNGSAGGLPLHGNGDGSLSLGSALEDDWSDLYFDSIRSEIGRLMSSSDDVQEHESLISSPLRRRTDPLGFNMTNVANPLFEQPSERVSSFNGFNRASVVASMPGNSSSAPSHVPVATIATETSKKKAPPGFTPADANPRESLAAFERLRSAQQHQAAAAPPAGPSPRALLPFGSRLPLFFDQMSATLTNSDDKSSHVASRGVGSMTMIGSGRDGSAESGDGSGVATRSTFSALRDHVQRLDLSATTATNAIQGERHAHSSTNPLSPSSRLPSAHTMQ
uniref:TMEM131L fourth Ig-like domain-containing protein n=1 Tax=Globisporangium ultimum (strain ATCC 200006 / CBS 805.95 / DAOM BR144) TaxID=431595 RepID=K3WH75_GLOUD